MGGLELSVTNVVHIISLTSPILITFFILMLSLFNVDIKGIIYLMGILITMLINRFVFMNLVKQERSPDEALSCEIFTIFGDPFPYNSPASSSVFIAFTTMYLLLPMFSSNSPDNYNYPVIAFFLSLFCVDAYSKIMKRCNKLLSIMLGLGVGLLFGGLWYSLFKFTGNEEFLFMNELKSNRAICSKPSDQKFVCKVYKNGKLLA